LWKVTRVTNEIILISGTSGGCRVS